MRPPQRERAGSGPVASPGSRTRRSRPAGGAGYRRRARALRRRRRRCASPRPPMSLLLSTAWSSIVTASAVSCPPISVTYWKLDQKSAPLARRHFRQIGRARAIFAADRQALQHPRDDQDDRRRPRRSRRSPARRAIISDPRHISADRQRQPGLAAMRDRHRRPIT